MTIKVAYDEERRKEDNLEAHRIQRGKWKGAQGTEKDQNRSSERLEGYRKYIKWKWDENIVVGGIKKKMTIRLTPPLTQTLQGVWKNL